MKRPLILAVAILSFVFVNSASAGVITAVFFGPDSDFEIDLQVTNDPSSTSDIVSLVLDGGTATAFPVLWDDAGSAIDPAGATSGISGENSQKLTINFADSPDGFNPTDFFQLIGMDPDGDPGPAGVTVGQLIGVTLTATFRDHSVFVGRFVDDPSEAGGLTLEGAQVPEPVSLSLLGAGMAAFALRRRNRSSN